MNKDKLVQQMVWYKNTLYDIRDYCTCFMGTNPPVQRIKDIIDERLIGNYIDFFEEKSDD